MKVKPQHTHTGLLVKTTRKTINAIKSYKQINPNHTQIHNELKEKNSPEKIVSYHPFILKKKHF